MMQVATKPTTGRPRTSFSIADIVGRPRSVSPQLRSRSPRQRSPTPSSGSASPQSSENGRDTMTSPQRASLDEVRARLDHFKNKLAHGGGDSVGQSPASPTLLKGFQPVLPGIPHAALRGLHPHSELLVRSGLSLPPDSLGFLQHSLQPSSHPLLHHLQSHHHHPLGSNNSPSSPGAFVHPHHPSHHGGIPFPVVTSGAGGLPMGGHNPLAAAAASKDLFNLYHLQMQGGPPFVGHRFPEGLFLPPFRKPKRIRTAFSPSQLLQLENAFEKNHYVVGQERKELAINLNLTETQVKVWFQNRRTKFKRVKSEESDHGDQSDRGEGHSDESIDMGHMDYMHEVDIDITDSEDNDTVT